MVYIETGSMDPYFNLAFEEYVFSELDRSKEYFMLWQNDRAIVIGKYQNTSEEINLPFVEAHGIRVVRRLSGGGAVYHDMGNLNFTYIVDAQKHRDFDFKVFILPLISVLDTLGIRAEYTGRNDITIAGRKFSGNSQYISDGRLLHHGTLMLSSDLSIVREALRVSDDKLRSKSIKSVRSRVTTIARHANRSITMEEFKQLILSELFVDEPPERWVPDESELTQIRSLRDRKYASWEWNFGRDPKYGISKKRYIEGVGSISVSMDIEDGRICALAMNGDYFGSKSSDGLAALLLGCRLEERALAERLSGVVLSRYILNLGVSQFISLLTQ